jgi:DNA-binding cell septation regulator SpoVG
MKISSIRIESNTLTDAQVLGTAEVILDDSLSLRGIKILRGRYGLFLAFPGLRSGSPHRAFDALSMRFRKDLQVAILAAFRDRQSMPISLFAECLP